MSINKINPNGFKYRDIPTSAQLNQLDTNATYGLDKRSGQTDNLQSIVTVKNGGGVIVANDGYLTINNPNNVSIGPGVLSIGAQLQGDVSQNDTLRFGYQAVAITNGTNTLSASQSNTFVIKLTGALTGNATVILPNVVGTVKAIDNQCTVSGDGYTVTVITNSVGATGVIFSALAVFNNSGGALTYKFGKQAMVYCDGFDYKLASQTQPNSLINLFHHHDPANFNTNIYTLTNTTTAAIDPTYKFTFYNVNVGDIFDITYQLIFITSPIVGPYTVQVINSQTGILPETVITLFQNPGSTFPYNIQTYWVSPANYNSIVWELDTFVPVGGNIGIYSPLNFTVKQYRP